MSKSFRTNLNNNTNNINIINNNINYTLNTLNTQKSQKATLNYNIKTEPKRVVTQTIQSYNYFKLINTNNTNNKLSNTYY